MSDPSSFRGQRKRFRLLWIHFSAFSLSLLIIAAAAGAVLELRFSWIQSRIFSSIVKKATYTVEAGANPDLLFPQDGPYDKRFGYAGLGEILKRTGDAGFEIVSQARISPDFQDLVKRGYFAPYREKDQAGLTLLDSGGEVVLGNLYPRNVYPSFDAIPPLVRDSLLYIENRELLSERSVCLNPAVEWHRLFGSMDDLFLKVLGMDRNVPGASTLATQIEKFRHSPEGRTHSFKDKYRQMISASLRAYLDGPDTLGRRREILKQYINSIPLAALSGYGEVLGLSDGLWAWYGTDFTETNDLLQADSSVLDDQGRVRRAVIYRQILSLFLAQRRPSYYLASGSGREELARLTDQHLRRMMEEKVVPRMLGEEALKARIQPRVEAPALPGIRFVEKKAQNQMRSSLLSVLGIARLYDLDRMDLTVHTSIDMAKQGVATLALQRMADGDYIRDSGLAGERLLSRGDPSRVIYSLTLSERTPDGNRIRIQTDNFNGPLNINEGSRIELGSTAKLRTLITYLEIIERLHNELSPLSPEFLRSYQISPKDPLGEWARGYLLDHSGAGLKEMLAASMDRKYSANPGERFMTGGGTQSFENFDSKWNRSSLTVTEGFRHSVNLVWVRVMRDIVRHNMYRSPNSTSRIIEDENHPARREYLARFAEREGGIFMERFLRKYSGLKADVVIGTMVADRRLNPIRMAWAFRAVNPMASPEELHDFLASNAQGIQLTEGASEDLYRRTDPEGRPLADLGYLASVHPLELWTVRYLMENRGATRTQVLDASLPLRQEVYQWLFKTGRRNAQDIRIRSILEMEAFSEVLQSWKRHGYPFDNIVPSLGTAIGSSGDRPASLAELVGILLNGGVHLPSIRIERLQFAIGTPYETTLERKSQKGIRILSEELSEVARGTLLQVVEGGTASRIRGVVVDSNGTVLPIGGKTGTGDNRFRIFAPGGREVNSYAVNRTSTFVFFIGDRYFGVVTAYVPGPEAGEFVFTSALPVEILRRLLPQLQLY